MNSPNSNPIAGCPYHAAGQMRQELSPPPPQMRHLPLDHRGYPVPFFVSWVDGKPEFRAADGDKLRRCLRQKLCWICGGQLGKHLAFVLGPMCGINRTSAEPPSHRDCAIWSAVNCPFLNQRQVRRRWDKDMTPERFVEENPGIAIDRQPGAVAVWLTKNYQLFPVERGHLFRVGEADEVLWFTHGRPATRAEVETAVRLGLPALETIAAEDGPEAQRYLALCVQQLEVWYPKATLDAGVPGGVE